MLNRGDDFFHGVRVGGVRSDADIGEGIYGFKAIGHLGDQNQIGVEGHDGFDAGIDDAADFRFVLSVFGEITIVGVAYQAILQTKGVEGFGQIWGERNDPADGLRDANGAA
jgi:hypothetical protein